VPLVVPSVGIPVAFDPLIVRARPRWHAVRSGRRRLADADAEGNLRVGCRGREQQQARNYQNLYKCFHDRIYRKRRASR
jgi:hypothetical protein